MADNVVTLDGLTTLDIPCERVLNGALEAGLSQVMVIGWKDGDLYTAASTAHLKDLHWLLESAREDLREHARPA